MDWLIEKLLDFDLWLINNKIHSGLLAISVGILLSIWVIPILWDHFSAWFYGKRRSEFHQDFSRERNEDARESFRRTVFFAYENYQIKRVGEHQKISLPILVDKATIPYGIPLPEGNSISKFGQSVKDGVDEYTRILWEFCEEIFPVRISEKTKFEVSGNKIFENIIDERDYRLFLFSRRVTAKFWNKWARSIYNGDIKKEYISQELAANRRDIKLLCFMEIIHAAYFDWDESVGKTWLFKLAKNDPVPHSSRLKQKLSALVPRISITWRK